jgi:hypothetical protein
MEIRDLKAEDFFKISEIAEKVSADLVDKITDDVSEKQFGIHLFLTVLRYVPGEIKEFLAHVTDQTPEELSKKSFNEPIKIFRELYKKEEFKDFLHEMKSLKSEISLK